jgi:hypothetical protein
MSMTLAIYVGIATLLLGAGWIVLHGQVLTDGKSAKQKKMPTRIDELVEARQRLERQIEILERPAGANIQDAPPNTDAEMKKLKRVLAEITLETEHSSKAPSHGPAK